MFQVKTYIPHDTTPTSSQISGLAWLGQTNGPPLSPWQLQKEDTGSYRTQRIFHGQNVTLSSMMAFNLRWVPVFAAVVATDHVVRDNHSVGPVWDILAFTNVVVDNLHVDLPQRIDGSSHPTATGAAFRLVVPSLVEQGFPVRPERMRLAQGIDGLGCRCVELLVGPNRAPSRDEAARAGWRRSARPEADWLDVVVKEDWLLRNTWRVPLYFLIIQPSFFEKIRRMKWSMQPRGRFISVFVQNYVFCFDQADIVVDIAASLIVRMRNDQFGIVGPDMRLKITARSLVVLANTDFITL